MDLITKIWQKSDYITIIMSCPDLIFDYNSDAIVDDKIVFKMINL